MYFLFLYLPQFLKSAYKEFRTFQCTSCYHHLFQPDLNRNKISMLCYFYKLEQECLSCLPNLNGSLLENTRSHSAERLAIGFKLIAWPTKLQSVSNMMIPILTRSSLKVNCTPSLRGNALASPSLSPRNASSLRGNAYETPTH